MTHDITVYNVVDESTQDEHVQAYKLWMQVYPDDKDKVRLSVFGIVQCRLPITEDVGVLQGKLDAFLTLIRECNKNGQTG